MEESLMETEDLKLSCPEFTEFSEQMLSRVSFWVEGFLSCSIAMAGFLGNVGSAVILSGKGISRSCQNLMFNINLLHDLSYCNTGCDEFIRGIQNKGPKREFTPARTHFMSEPKSQRANKIKF